MKYYRECAIAILLLACGAMPALAQEDGLQDGKRTCTDLSGSVNVPCPGERKTAAFDEIDAAEAKQSPDRPPAPQVAPKQAKVQPTVAASSSPSPARPASVRQPIGVPYEDAASTTFSSGDGGASPVMEPEPVAPTAYSSRRSPERALVSNLIADQKAIWTSPLRLRLDNVQWLAPLLAGTAVVIASDTDIERHVPTGATFRKDSNRLSNYAVGGAAAITGATWLWGVASRNEKMRETGVLSGEAALDSFALTYAIKSITQRDRPYQSNGHGNFWSKGDSFPSEHAAAAWSVATVFAHEYPGPLTKLLAYGGATAVSAARVTSGKHFASDALVGSALGYFIGRQVYRAHHDRGNDGAYGTFVRTREPEGPRDPANMGSSYVALDSWVYPAMDRLAALGYIHTAFAGLRPWSRMECARLLEEAGAYIQSDAGDGTAEALRLYRALQAEFLMESRRREGGRNVSAELESIYTRFTGISGKPLNDSYHFGQTMINDYGRPYQQGFNMVTGFTSHAEAGPLAFYVRGEYQHSPFAPAYSLNVRQAIATMDANPLQPAVPFASHNDFQLLDTYVALNIKDNQISFGRQSLWWGPGDASALMLTDNALPMYMLRWNRVSPTRLPSLLRFLGPMRTEAFIAKPEGHHFPAHPYMSGQKVSFKPTENLELGFSKLTVFAGGSTPLTWHTFYKATFSVDDRNPLVADLPGFDPGDRRGGFDFSYRVPGLRKWLTIYNDSLSDDDPSPLAAPRRAAMNPGIYLSHVPGIQKLDFRAEAVYTDLPTRASVGGRFVYYNSNYHDSHTNQGSLLGSWVGREGTGLQVSSKYWFSPQNTIRLSYRNQHVDNDFVPRGGDLNHFTTDVQWLLRSDWSLNGRFDYERWFFPVLSQQPQTNFAGSLQITYRPHWGIGSKSR